MDKFEKEELKRQRKKLKNIWFHCLINYVPKPIANLQVVLKIRFKSSQFKI